MLDGVPPGARASARVLLLDAHDRLLLLEAEESWSGHRFWVTPGGGLEPGETFEAAAARELAEETGLALPILRWVWTRRHVFTWEGRPHDQYERFFVARTREDVIAPHKRDGYIVGHRWWRLEELATTSEDLAPRRLAALLPPILRGDYPDPPIDCGV